MYLPMKLLKATCAYRCSTSSSSSTPWPIFGAARPALFLLINFLTEKRAFLDVDASLGEAELELSEGELKDLLGEEEL